MEWHRQVRQVESLHIHMLGVLALQLQLRQVWQMVSML